MKLFSALSLVLIASVTISCTDDANPVTEVVVEKTVIQNVDSAKIISSDTTVTFLESEVLGLTDENNEEKQLVSSLNGQVKSLNKENDSLRTDINQKKQAIKGLANAKQKPISHEELGARALIQDLNTAWVSLPGAENTDAFMSLFLPDFAVSMVSVGIDDQAEVKMLYKDEFKKLLEKVRVKENFSLQIGNVDYVYFDGRNDIYSIVYTAILRSYQDEVATVDRSFVATVTVKKVDNQWKIGKYSWASMGHKLR